MEQCPCHPCHFIRSLLHPTVKKTCKVKSKQLDHLITSTILPGSSSGNALMASCVNPKLPHRPTVPRCSKLIRTYSGLMMGDFSLDSRPLGPPIGEAAAAPRCPTLPHAAPRCTCVSHDTLNQGHGQQGQDRHNFG